jgi:hypothetical protein
MGKNRFVADAVNVAPRRKKIGETSVQRSADRIQISKELILSLASKPLAKAAQSVGISETALKRACRELGFQKWPRVSCDIEIKLEDLCRSSSASSSSSFTSPWPQSPDDLSACRPAHTTELEFPKQEIPAFCAPRIAAGTFVPQVTTIDDELEMLRMERSAKDSGGPFYPQVKIELEEDSFLQHCLLSARIARTANLPDVDAGSVSSH